MLIKPKALKSGNRIQVFLASSPVKEVYLKAGIDFLEKSGFIVGTVSGILGNDGLLAKQPKMVIEDLQKAFKNPEIDVLWAGRGGYGANYLLPLLKDLNIDVPKIVIGSSDLSYLLWYLLDRFNMTVFYGPMVCSTMAKGEFNAESLFETLSGDYSRIKLEGRVLKHGNAEGIITGGCLSNLVSLLGTKYFPLLDDRILFIEDINERPHKIDRMIWQLVNSNKLTTIRGLMIGEFQNTFFNVSEKEDLYRRIKNNLGFLSIPVLVDLPIGHVKDAHTLPLGVRVEIETQNFSGVVIKEKGVIL
jgi:muramoyltetrapeptide carboxypeptidase